MARKPGDTNYSARDLKFIAQINEQAAKAKAKDATIKVLKATIKELREKLG